MINDNLLRDIFVVVIIVCFCLYFKAANETRILLKLYAKKYKTDTYEDLVKKMVSRPLIGPFWAIKKSFSMLLILFKRTNDPEIDIHVNKIRKYYFTMILLMVLLFLGIIIYAFAVHGLPHTRVSVYGLP